MADFSWGITFAFYTRVKTVQTAGSRCHADRASLLSLAPTLACNQEVAHRRKAYLHILDSIPRLSDSSLLLAPAGPFKLLWLGSREEEEAWEKDGGWRVNQWNYPFPGRLMTFFVSNVTRELALNFKSLCIKWDNVNVWPCHGLHPYYLHGVSPKTARIIPHHACSSMHIIKGKRKLNRPHS